VVGWYSDDRVAALSHAETAVELARRADDRPAICGSLVQRAVVQYRWGDAGKAASDLLEALALLPPRNDVDAVLVFSASTGLLIDAGRPDLACCVVDHVERVTMAAGWVPVAEWLPALEDLRRAACAQLGNEPCSTLTTTIAVGQQVRSVLQEFVQ